MSGHRTARVLVYTHRWLGIALGILFVGWFASGIVMVYARLPELDPVERLARLPALVPATVRVAPPAAERLSITSLEGRPVFRVTAGGRTTHLFADTGDPVPKVDADQARRIAGAFLGGHVAVRYDARLTDADQWTFAVRGRMPLHRIAVDDAARTRLYVTEESGDVVMKTTASGRRWGYAGAVLHWLYFAPLRRHAGVWHSLLVWSSIAGTVLCAAGLARGLWRFAPWRGYRQCPPDASSMRWHHYAGLIFGAAAAAWIFSGLLSMNPWGWHPGTAPLREQRERVAALPGPIAVRADQLRSAVAAFAPRLPKEVEVVTFHGRYYAAAAGGVVALDAPQFGAQEQIAPDLIVGAASLAMPGVPIDGMRWMDDYDAYYYDRSRRLSLPVLRVRYADSQATWLYFDPRRGTIARKEERLTRVNRWLYHGLHSLDFPFLYYRRPLWDLVVIVLSVGGLILSATTLAGSWRRVRRWGRRLTASQPGGFGTGNSG